jgi:hypothetical protein
VKLDPVQSAEQAAQARADHYEEVASNREIVFVTWVIAGVAFAQLVMFGWQLLKIKAGLEDTKKAADAAHLSAQAAVNVERPHVVCTEVVLEEIPPRVTHDPETGVITPDPDEVRRGERYWVHFVLTNYGRTPANDLRVGWGLQVGQAPPAKVTWEMLRNIQSVLKPDEVASFRLPGELTITPEERRAINEDKVNQWFWGCISYSDFFDGVAEIGFIATYRTTATPPGREVYFWRSPVGYVFRGYTIGEGEPRKLSRLRRIWNRVQAWGRHC